MVAVAHLWITVLSVTPSKSLLFIFATVATCALPCFVFTIYLCNFDVCYIRCTKVPILSSRTRSNEIRSMHPFFVFVCMLRLLLCWTLNRMLIWFVVHDFVPITYFACRLPLLVFVAVSVNFVTCLVQFITPQRCGHMHVEKMMCDILYKSLTYVFRILHSVVVAQMLHTRR